MRLIKPLPALDGSVQITLAIRSPKETLSWLIVNRFIIILVGQRVGAECMCGLTVLIGGIVILDCNYNKHVSDEPHNTCKWVFIGGGAICLTLASM